MLFAFNGYIGDYANSKKTINKIIIKLRETEYLSSILNFRNYFDIIL